MNSSSRTRSAPLEVVIMLQNITMKGTNGDMRMLLWFFLSEYLGLR